MIKKKYSDNYFGLGRKRLGAFNKIID